MLSKNFNFFLVLVLILICKGEVNGQTKSNSDFIEVPSYPEIGKPMQFFALDSVEYFKTRSLTLNDLKGKWTMLDFWGEYCGGCISSFPEISSIQQRFKDTINYVLVGLYYKDHPLSIRKFYEKLRSKFNLSLPISFDNSLFDEVNINGMPVIIVIDPIGIVRAITPTIKVNDIELFLRGKRTYIKPCYFEARVHDQNAKQDYIGRIGE